MIQSFTQIIPEELCLSCDICCRFDNEKSPWRPKVSREEKDSFKGCQWDGNYLIAQSENSLCRCTFFDRETQKCQVYFQRPLECKIYPFVIVKKDSKIFICVHLVCPFVQKNMGSEMFQNWVEEVKTFFLREDVLDFLRKNFYLAGDYSFFENELMDILEVKI